LATILIMTTLEDATLAGTATARPNFANHHLEFALDFARRAYHIETEHAGQGWGSHAVDVQREVIATVFFSVASLEAWVNEIGADPARRFPALDARLIAAALELAERRQLLEKLQLLAELRQGNPPDYGRPPAQDLPLVVDLRNALVHYRPEFASGARHGRIGQRLEQRVQRTPFLSRSEPMFPRGFASYDCARWAVETVRDFLAVFGAANDWPHPTSKPSKAQAMVLPPR
jgi:hypothetical protein